MNYPFFFVIGLPTSLLNHYVIKNKLKKALQTIVFKEIVSSIPFHIFF